MNPTIDVFAHEVLHADASFHRGERSMQRTVAIDETETAVAAVRRLRDALDEAFAAVSPGAAPARSQCPEFARRVRAALAQAAAEETLLTSAQREGEVNSYRRHVLVADPQGRYAVAALVWQPGQASPVHAHHTWCGYAVLDGVLHETLYAWDDAADCAAPSRTRPRESGAVSYVRAGLNAIHRLGNDGSRPAVSLHVYGVSGERLPTHVNRLVAA
ncbi:cysteine dioxygenase [Trinickia sp.]|uniref:cysteine dioxygenase n=1 Tax=Trinickia sp. TaxID=2571163 RepID=UPI003F7E62EE